MHPSISRAALRGLFLPLLSLPLLCASLLACAGPDDRGPSSPVAGAHRPGALIFPFESDGSVRSRDPLATMRMRGAHRVDGVLSAFDGSAASRSATNRCSAIGDASHRRRRDADALRVEPLAHECRAHFDATAPRPWLRVR